MHGQMSLDQLWAARPVLGHGDYRGPIKGLYMCGAGTHPGGGVTGAPGHNAAHEILRDRSCPQAGCSADARAARSQVERYRGQHQRHAQQQRLRSPSPTAPKRERQARAPPPRHATRSTSAATHAPT